MRCGFPLMFAMLGAGAPKLRFLEPTKVLGQLPQAPHQPILLGVLYSLIHKPRHLLSDDFHKDNGTSYW